MVFLGLVSAAGEFLDENNIPLGNFLDEGGDVFSALREHRTLSAMEDWLLRLFRAIFQRVEANRAGRTTMLVRKAKKYIERNYGRSSLGLDHIAEYCGVTPSYASTVFKKEMGLSVVEYLTEYRLKKAKEIMDRDPLHPIMDVAEDVGYQDAYYFSKCFRRIFGISPSLYLGSKNSGEG
jgi:two-component system response regulator YesN